MENICPPVLLYKFSRTFKLRACLRGLDQVWISKTVDPGSTESSRQSLNEEIDRRSKQNNGGSLRLFAARVISTLATSNRATRTPRSLAMLNARNE